jgi:molybdopterin biosynthesis enzyme
MSASWENVLASCLQLAARPGRESMVGAWALGRVLAQPVKADRDYPAGDLGMMDGYAVATLTERPLRVEGEIVLARARARRSCRARRDGSSRAQNSRWAQHAWCRRNSRS